MAHPLILIQCCVCDRYEPVTGPPHTVNVLVADGFQDKDNPMLLDTSETSERTEFYCTTCASGNRGLFMEGVIREAEIALFID